MDHKFLESFDDYFNNRMEHINSEIKTAKEAGKESIIFPFYVPLRQDKRFDGFKSAVFDAIKEQGCQVTDFIPGTMEQSLRGYRIDIFICWTEKARHEAEGTPGYVFK